MVLFSHRLQWVTMKNCSGYSFDCNPDATPCDVAQHRWCDQVQHVSGKPADLA
jgi:hypothetical protein